jgi:hypothetical protein
MPEVFTNYYTFSAGAVPAAEVFRDQLSGCAAARIRDLLQRFIG